MTVESWLNLRKGTWNSRIIYTERVMGCNRDSSWEKQGFVLLNITQSRTHQYLALIMNLIRLNKQILLCRLNYQSYIYIFAWGWYIYNRVRKSAYSLFLGQPRNYFIIFIPTERANTACLVVLHISAYMGHTQKEFLLVQYQERQFHFLLDYIAENAF